MKSVDGTRTGGVFATVVATAAILATAQATVNTAWAANLVPNGDFEKEDRGALAAWMPLDTVPDRLPNNIHGVSTGYANHFDRLPNRTGRDRDTLLREASTPLLCTTGLYVS